MNYKLTNSVFLLPLILISFTAQSGVQGEKNSLSAQYFGEKPPGLTPEIFAPGILSPDGLFEGGTYSPDMKEFYFSRKNGKYKQRTFFVIRYENNKWGRESVTDIKWPLFSVDGNTMYVGKTYRKKTQAGWSEPKQLGEFIKEQAHGKSISANGTFYFPFFKKEDKGHGYLGYSTIEDGKYQEPVRLGPQINHGNYIAHPYVAPDESFLMWDVERHDNIGSEQPDIYISFKRNDDSWGPAINMGNKINTSIYEQSPRLTPDGKYLFFSRGEWITEQNGSRKWVGRSYWVDASIIEEVRPKG